MDGVDNRITVETTEWQQQQPTIDTYQTNDLNQYYQINSVTHLYDNNGNLKDDGIMLYKWDYANRLVEIWRNNNPNELIARFKSDALGRRIEKVTTSGTIRFVLDGDRVIEERDGNNTLLATYTFGNGIDEILTMERNSQTYYFHENTLGSIYAVTDGSGNIVEKYKYGRIRGTPYSIQ